jgi:uncharacterized protein
MPKSPLRLAIVVLSLLFSNWSYAASFDCGSAKTRVERLICDHADLSHLDDQLGSTFKSVLPDAADQAAVIETQRGWMKARNRCTDVACLGQAYSERLAALKGVKRADWKTYNDPELGISFEYLGNRQVKKPCPHRSGERCVALVGRDMGISDYIIAFKVVNGSLDKVAANEGGFVLDDGKWVTAGVVGVPESVEDFDGPGWKGMRATSACPVYDPESGPHTGFCFTAVMSTGMRAVIANTEGSIGDDRVPLHRSGS